MKIFPLLSILVLAMVLVACGSPQAVGKSDQGIANAISLPTATPQSTSSSGTDDLVRTDDQGMVSFSVTPLNLRSPGNTLDFEVSMNTHSVNLNMDVASLSTLTTDNSNEAQGTSWDGGSGGHHVSGTLVFPANVNGKSILDGATSLTLTIKDIDAPARIFTWSLDK